MIDLTVVYPTQAGAATPQYPQGSGKNDNTPGDQSGTPFDQQWFNTMWGFFSKLITESNVVISGNPDNAVQSDIYAALLENIDMRIAAAPPPSTAVGVSSESGTSYTLQDTDINSIVRFTSNSAITVTVPSDSAETIAIGQTIVVRPVGDGQITIAPDTGVTLESEIGLKSRAKYTYISLTKEAANTWGVSGGLEA